MILNKKPLLLTLLVILPLLLIHSLFAQQIPDTTFKFTIQNPSYKKGGGPVIFIDEAHNNFHTREGGFSAFSKLLEKDGYRVKSLNKVFSDSSVLIECKILIIVNALHESNINNWILPNRSAFTKAEINVIKQWVESGGSLFLIADHMPFAGAAYQLGRAFGFTFLNGFAKTGEDFWPPSVFSFKNGLLKESPVTSGLKKNENIDSVVTFTGSAFRSPENAMNVLSFKSEHLSLQPDTAWEFNYSTPRKNLAGYYQGALLPFGKGRVAVFGEAAMFTAQIANENTKVGFNSKLAPQNLQFTLNVIHWLDGIIK